MSGGREGGRILDWGIGAFAAGGYAYFAELIVLVTFDDFRSGDATVCALLQTGLIFPRTGSAAAVDNNNIAYLQNIMPK